MEEQTLSYDEFNATPTPLLDERYQWLCAPAVFALLTFFMFVDVLFSGTRVISHTTTDLALQFLPWREFGFTEMAHGNLPLWNPFIYGGAPYFAGFQSALLYPPNWLHLILPVSVAINWIVAVHVFMLGYFVYFWCRGRDVGISGSILAGVMFMFCGPYFLHLYAGHLPHLAVIVWTPLMLLTLDKLGRTGEWKWLLLGIFATSMDILAGHPQYVYYTGMAITAYAVLNMLDARHRGMLTIGFFGMYFGAVLLTAIQLFSGIEAATEGVRNAGLSLEMASTFSLPPRNLITLVAPTFFGNVYRTANGANELPYWGTGYLWEMSLFLSVTGLVLAVFAIVRSFEIRTATVAGSVSPFRRGLREIQAHSDVIVPGLMIVVTGILALGRFTPLYRLMYDYLPAYASFRGTVKFFYIASLFISLLAGMGFDALLKNRRVHPAIIIPFGAIVLILIGVGVAILLSGSDGPTGWWGSLVANVVDSSNESKELFNPSLLNAKTSTVFISDTARQASFSLIVGAVTLAAALVVLAFSRFSQKLPYVLLLLVMVEMFSFARVTRATMDAGKKQIPKAWSDQIAQAQALNKDARFLTLPIQMANSGMSPTAQFPNLNGYDPGVLRTYAELIAVSQGAARSMASQYLPFRIFNDINARVYRALRCAIIFPEPPNKVVPVDRPMPLASLCATWGKFPSEDDMLAYMVSPQWDPTQMVLVVSLPGLPQSNVPMMPTTASPGSVQVIGQGTDYLDLEADAAQNAMLLVTNNYSKGWRVVPLATPPEDQDEYLVLRVNYTQIGIPIRAGKHLIRLEYSPIGYRIGWWVSGASFLLLAAWGVLLMWRPSWFR